MSSKLLMTASAVCMAIAGLALSFAPAEVLAASGVNAVPALVVAAQLAGALYLGFAILDWMARESTIGGIYNRPLALGNFLHFGAGALALLKAASRTPHSMPGWIATAVYSLFAIGFGTVLFGSPRSVASAQ
ncbi:MAG TPA: hypothetical protein VGJ81_17280 [Thermoanaerobaculia bacterium]